MFEIPSAFFKEISDPLSLPAHNKMYIFLLSFPYFSYIRISLIHDGFFIIRHTEADL